MFPTVSHFLNYLFGIDVPLPFNTFGVFVALAFVAGYWAFSKELQRKEALGIIKPTKRTITIGEPASFLELASNAFFGFIIGYKLIYALLNYQLFVSDAQTVILSFKGNILGGLALAALFTYWDYKEKEKAKAKELEKKKKEESAAKAKEDAKKAAAEEKRAAALRNENLKRMQGMVGASGDENAKGTALKSSGPSASYAGRIRARIKPNITFTEDVAGNPKAEVEVRTSPDGTILSRKLLSSSGNKSWDEAVLKAIDKTATLPRDEDGRVPPVLEISFRPKD